MEYRESTQVAQAKAALMQHAPEETSETIENFRKDSDMARKITERVTEFITLDDQSIAVVENTYHLQIFYLMAVPQTFGVLMFTQCHYLASRHSGLTLLLISCMRYCTGFAGLIQQSM